MRVIIADLTPSSSYGCEYLNERFLFACWAGAKERAAGGSIAGRAWWEALGGRRASPMLSKLVILSWLAAGVLGNRINSALQGQRRGVAGFLPSGVVGLPSATCSRAEHFVQFHDHRCRYRSIRSLVGGEGDELGGVAGRTAAGSEGRRGERTGVEVSRQARRRGAGGGRGDEAEVEQTRSEAVRQSAMVLGLGECLDAWRLTEQ